MVDNSTLAGFEKSCCIVGTVEGTGLSGKMIAVCTGFVLGHKCLPANTALEVKALSLMFEADVTGTSHRYFLSSYFVVCLVFFVVLRLTAVLRRFLFSYLGGATAFVWKVDVVGIVGGGTAFGTFAGTPTVPNGISGLSSSEVSESLGSPPSGISELLSIGVSELPPSGISESSSIGISGILLVRHVPNGTSAELLSIDAAKAEVAPTLVPILNMSLLPEGLCDFFHSSTFGE